MPHPKQLIVEGDDDLSAISNLVTHHIPDFRDQNGSYLIHIKNGGGVEKILAKWFIRTELQQRELQILGFVIDADGDPGARWQGFRDLLRAHYPEIPDDLPNQGLIAEAEEKPRLGFWMMPDCGSDGMLEDFLHHLVPNHATDALWKYAKEATSAARTRGAPYKEAHGKKAEIHTWLAWQDEPGKRFGAALAAKILDPHAETAGPFLAWFKNLFDIA